MSETPKETPRCEVLGATPTVDDMCRKPAEYRYPAMGGGYAYLCEAHAQKHLPHCERFDGMRWLPAPGYPTNVR